MKTMGTVDCRAPGARTKLKAVLSSASLSARAYGFGYLTEGRFLGIADLLTSDTHKGTFSGGVSNFPADT